MFLDTLLVLSSHKHVQIRFFVVLLKLISPGTIVVRHYCKIINHNSDFLLDIVQFESLYSNSCDKGFSENALGTEYR